MITTDSALKTRVSAELAWDSAVDDAAIGVAVKDGIVTLTGHLDTYARKQAATRAVRRVAGIRAVVAAEIDVRLSPTHKRSDPDIAASAVGIDNDIRLCAEPQVADLTLEIEAALKRQALREAQQIHIAIDGHTVTLTGHVHSRREREAAQGVAWSAPGIRAVVNELQVA